MIFGFNTDIKHENTVYHVQSEARQHDLLLQTQIFVRGRCIGKHASSYADKVTEPGFSDEHMHDLLKNQHKNIIEAIRAGQLESIIGPIPKTGEIISPAAAQASAGGLSIQWLNANAIYDRNTLVMKFSVSDGSGQLPGVQLTSRLTTADDAPIYSQATTDAYGMAEIRIFLDEAALHDAAVLVQATHDGGHTTRKFQFRRTA